MNKQLVESLLMKLVCDTETGDKCCSDMGKQIVILQRGWVVVGDLYKEGQDYTLENASVIRSWGTTKGLGEIAENGPNDKTILDPSPKMRFHELTVVAMMECSKKWKNK